MEEAFSLDCVCGTTKPLKSLRAVCDCVNDNFPFDVNDVNKWKGCVLSLSVIVLEIDRGRLSDGSQRTRINIQMCFVNSD